MRVGSYLDGNGQQASWDVDSICQHVRRLILICLIPPGSHESHAQLESSSTGFLSHIHRDLSTAFIRFKI